LAKVPVIPVFINGLGNNFVKQVKGNFNGQGRKIIAVFGEPIDFGDLYDAEANGKTFRCLSERALEAIAKLGQEERARRLELEV
jgi:1-acyl-sn-glycerol-3-phosphate acyltransferase